jgi:branched-chain amino acid transport system ATP-binding protein
MGAEQVEQAEQAVEAVQEVQALEAVVSDALAVSGLSKRFGGLQAIGDVSLRVPEGSVQAVIGPNGAGKTTLISLLSGRLHADKGEIRLFGEPVQSLPQEARVRAGLARSFQITSVFNGMTVGDNLQVAIQRARAPGFGFLRDRARDREFRAEAARVAERVGVARHLETIAATLPHALRRRLDVGLAIACRPRVLLMDEPLAGMGHEESDAMVDLIRSLRADTTVVLIEHDMDAVFALADRIAVLVQGEIIASGTVAEIRADQKVKEAYLGEEEVEGGEPASAAEGMP